MQTRIRTLTSHVWSSLLHGCESWTINKNTEGRFNAAEMWFLRRMLQRTSNEEVLERAGIKRALLNVTCKRQLSFPAHFCRTGRSECAILVGKIEGKRARGWQRKTLLEWLRERLGNRHDSNNIMLRASLDRKEWKIMTIQVSGHGTWWPWWG